MQNQWWARWREWFILIKSRHLSDLTLHCYLHFHPSIIFPLFMIFIYLLFCLPRCKRNMLMFININIIRFSTKLYKPCSQISLTKVQKSLMNPIDNFLWRAKPKSTLNTSKKIIKENSLKMESSITLCKYSTETSPSLWCKPTSINLKNKVILHLYRGKLIQGS